MLLKCWHPHTINGFGVQNGATNFSKKKKIKSYQFFKNKISIKCEVIPLSGQRITPCSIDCLTHRTVGSSTSNKHNTPGPLPSVWDGQLILHLWPAHGFRHYEEVLTTNQLQDWRETTSKAFSTQEQEF